MGHANVVHRRTQYICALTDLATSDWRDEKYGLRYGRSVNMLDYPYARPDGQHESAEQLRGLIRCLDINGKQKSSYEQG